MKRYTEIVLLSFTLLFCGEALAQSGFTLEGYSSFLSSVRNLDTSSQFGMHALKTKYYNALPQTDASSYAYFDRINDYFHLTDSEIDLLEKNRFMVTERRSYDSFGKAYIDIYVKDLPVFITTDSILQALHCSYDQILKDMELYMMAGNLSTAMNALYDSFPALVEKYGGDSRLDSMLGDVDLYITMAVSLIDGEKRLTQRASQETFDKLWNAVESLQSVTMPLFSEKKRMLDFSQFKVRGHYEGDPVLEKYFRSMMLLGRIDFIMTSPPVYPPTEAWSRDDLRRMCISVMLLDELLDSAAVRPLLDENGTVIDFLVGKSDNLTPNEFTDFRGQHGFESPLSLFDEDVFDSFQAAIQSSTEYGQKILSSIFIMDPFSPTPDKLPVSYRLMGQRFVLDSYIFSNVVYDRIINGGEKVWRPMPDPLDAMYVLGSDDALRLLEDELKKYHYNSQLESLRYLVDAYDDSFWEETLYNSWLNTLRKLNPPADDSGMPLFMKTPAWHQEKLNTQLASWAQLRHDTLLYAKQSYTGGGFGCSFPDAYIEPYPEFFANLSRFAESAETFFSGINNGAYAAKKAARYYTRFGTVMEKLETLTRKELAAESFTDEENDYLKKILFRQTVSSGGPIFTGWYAEIYYDAEDSYDSDIIVADVHTQPTDEEGSMVGNVLHVGVGRINLGVFLIEPLCDNGEPIAYVGPLNSYYEHVTGNFERLTDSEWRSLVLSDQRPARPDWVNSYLADNSGAARPAGRELPGVPFEGVGVEEEETVPAAYPLVSVYPNPFNPGTTIRFTVPGVSKVEVTVFDLLGRKIATLADETMQAGVHSIVWNATGMPSGVYFCRVRAGERERTAKMLLMK